MAFVLFACAARQAATFAVNAAFLTSQCQHRTHTSTSWLERPRELFFRSSVRPYRESASEARAQSTVPLRGHRVVE